ncbi:hypothetical protein, conserved [Eimeria maxima]|uniref:Uncharacterized protein n=1 Tax=Eimeria maxima TaxID=5804 RepID=U6MAG4_EIMMA|nr:hypothetical protein, conserved [Eimeria maxima]CDJ61016.1 hypothetical protein, conserved [Eimeria maxima]
MPTLDVVDASPVSDELDNTEGARTSPDHANPLVQTGLVLPIQFKTRTLQGQHMHANDLPEPFFSAPICGHLVAAAAEHPEELSPQSAMEKKTPSDLNGRCRTEGDGSSSINGPCIQLHTGCEPLSHPGEPSIQSTQDGVTKQSDLRFLESRQLQRDVQEQDFNEPHHTTNEKCLADEVVQPMDAAPERIRSILSQEELLEGAEKNLDAASNAIAEHDTSAHDMEIKKDDGQSTISTTISHGRILRSKTVIGPTLCSSPVPQDTAVRRETALVQWNHHENASPSVDSTRGRRKTYTPAGSQCVQQTQSDARGLSFGDVHVEWASGEVVKMLTDDIDSSCGSQRRGTYVFRRSPERHREYLITRSTPENYFTPDNHLPCHPTSPFSSCRQEAMIKISADAENIRREPGQEKQGVSNTGPECEATITTGNATQSGLVMRGGERNRPHHYDDAVTVQQVAGDGGGEESSCNTSSLSASNTTKDKVIGAHLTTRVQLFEKFPSAFSPAKSSLSGCIVRESIVEATLREHHAVANGCDDAAAQSVTASKPHRMGANARLCSFPPLKRRAASCIESISHVITQQQFNSGPPMSCRQRASKSLSCSAGSPEDAQQALVLIKQPKEAYVTAHVQVACSPIADTPRTGDALSKEPMDSGPRRSSTVPPRRSEADHVFRSVLAPEEEGTVAFSGCAIGAAYPCPLLVGTEKPYQEPRTPQVFPMELRSDVDSKTDRDLIFATSSRIPYSQLTQGHAANMSSKLLRGSATLADVEKSAHLLHEPGPESSARPHELPLGLSGWDGITEGEVTTESGCELPQSGILPGGGFQFNEKTSQTQCCARGAETSLNLKSSSGGTWGKTTAFCTQEGPAAFLEGAAAAALAILGACGQRAHKPLVGSEALAFPLSDPTQRLAGTSKTEDIGGAAAGPPPEVQQEPLTPKVRKEALPEKRRTSLGPSMKEECAQKSQDEVLYQTLGSDRGVARQFQRNPAPIKESDESFTNPQQNEAHYKRNTLQTQRAPPQISQLDASETLEKGSADSAGPMLPRATAELPCPKLAIGLELSFPSPGGAIQYERSYSRMDVTLAPGQPG